MIAGKIMSRDELYIHIERIPMKEKKVIRKLFKAEIMVSSNYLISFVNLFIILPMGTLL